MLVNNLVYLCALACTVLTWMCNPIAPAIASTPAHARNQTQCIEDLTSALIHSAQHGQTVQVHPNGTLWCGTSAATFVRAMFDTQLVHVNLGTQTYALAPRSWWVALQSAERWHTDMWLGDVLHLLHNRIALGHITRYTRQVYDHSYSVLDARFDVVAMSK